MCIILIAVGMHEEVPLALMFNRDVGLARPTQRAALGIMEKFPSIIAGKDVLAGGTWLGVCAKTGRFCANLDVPSNPQPMPKGTASRGTLPPRFISSPPEATPQSFTQGMLKEDLDKYDGFSLICADLEPGTNKPRVAFVTNSAVGPQEFTGAIGKERMERTHRALDLSKRGLYALSNEGRVVTFVEESSFDTTEHLNGHEKAFKYMDTETTCATENQGPIAFRYLAKCRRALHHMRFIFNGTSMKNPRKPVEGPLTAERLLQRFLEEVMSDDTDDKREGKNAEGQRPICLAKPKFEHWPVSRTTNMVFYKPKEGKFTFLEKSYEAKGAYIDGGDPPVSYDFPIPTSVTAARL